MALKKYLLFFLYIVTVAYVAFIAFSLHRLGDTTDLLYQYPFIVSREATEMRTRLGEISRTLPLYVGRPGVRHEEVYAFLREQEQYQDAALARLRGKFRGRESEINALTDKLAELRKMRRDFIADNVANDDLSEVEKSYSKQVLPEFRDVDALLEEISAGADARALDLVEEMNGIRRTSVVLTLLVGVIILLLIMYTHRLERSRIAEVVYRERLFRLLGENIDEVFLIAGADGSLEYVSFNSGRILGIDAGKLHEDPRRFTALFDAPVAEWLRELVLRQHGRHPSERDVTLYPGDGSAPPETRLPSGGRFFKVRVYPIWVGGVFQRTIMVLNDQTDAIRSQQALNDALQNARTANSAKSNFLSHMSHEIRTPMNAIIGMTTIALSHMSNPGRVEDCLGKIALSSRHLLGLINDILDMAKIEEGKLNINREPFDLKDSLQSLATLVMPQIEERGLNFDILVHSEGIENLEGDALRLNQILLNLLSNSIKFTPRGGSVVLEVRQVMARHNNVRLEFRIRDTGIGMSREALERLYRPFEQASASTAAKFGGTGLGMAITQNLITLLGGTIQVESEEGKGTTFTVELPFKLEENGEPLECDGELGPLRILVVDDDQGTCEHADLLLDKMGMSVRWTLNGRDALQLLHEAHDGGQDFDICVIDWKMPDMDGKELARRIRLEIGASNIILILASAYDYSVIEEEARAVGVDAFIPKPFFASSLYNTLCTVTRRAARANQARAAAAVAAEVAGNTEETAAHAGPDALDAPAAPVADAPAGKTKGDLGRFDFSGCRVLLAEDNEFNQEIACEFLDMVGATVDVAANGREALEKFTASAPGTYACVLMDVQMPEMDGHAATRAIRALEREDARAVPIIAMTANAFDEDVTAALAAGMDGHLAKPLDVQTMYRLMDEKIHGGRDEQAHAAETGAGPEA
ncbi:response regulator [uncultured Desulfovibrio sp.]|uniref:hybrid sensor histidine kinase/response regulator n=3 Tax=uncultured Desulfovibrio sp. TaxID=167968 RepID=UPI0025CCDC91|nr:response regulator [uncultured Desulfovibrio sp.]